MSHDQSAQPCFAHWQQKCEPSCVRQAVATLRGSSYKACLYWPPPAQAPPSLSFHWLIVLASGPTLQEATPIGVRHLPRPSRARLLRPSIGPTVRAWAAFHAVLPFTLSGREWPASYPTVTPQRQGPRPLIRRPTSFIGPTLVGSTRFLCSTC